MGRILKAVCTECGFEKEIFEGGGKNDCNLTTILSAFPESRQSELSEAFSLGATQISINREPCSCTSCGNIYAVPVVSYLSNGAQHSISGRCPECNSESFTSTFLCPECGNEISLKETGLWD